MYNYINKLDKLLGSITGYPLILIAFLFIMDFNTEYKYLALEIYFKFILSIFLLGILLVILLTIKVFYKNGFINGINILENDEELKNY